MRFKSRRSTISWVFFIKSIQGERNKYIFFSYRIEFLLGPVALLALVLNHEFSLMEILWTFSIYLESVAILPQLFMVQKTGEAESITSHYLFALGSYRGLYILNWIYRYYFEGKLWISTRHSLIHLIKHNYVLYWDLFFVNQIRHSYKLSKVGFLENVNIISVRMIQTKYLLSKNIWNCHFWKCRNKYLYILYVNVHYHWLDY